MIRNALERVRARLAPTIWRRRWVVIWNAGADLRTDAEWLAYHLPRFGFEVVCVKVCDGPATFAGSHNLNVSDEWLAPLRKARLRIAGWGYSYGYEAGKEAVRAVELAHELALEAFVIDAEKEYEYDPADSPQRGSGAARYGAARQWLHVWRSARRRPPLGLTSYGRVDLHRLDWAAFAKAGARFLPQAYANETLELAPALCVRAAATYFERARVHPWIGCYAGAGGRVAASEYVAMLREAGTRGFGVYLGDTVTVDELDTLGEAR